MDLGKAQLKHSYVQFTGVNNYDEQPGTHGYVQYTSDT